MTKAKCFYCQEEVSSDCEVCPCCGGTFPLDLLQTCYSCDGVIDLDCEVCPHCRVEFPVDGLVICTACKKTHRQSELMCPHCQDADCRFAFANQVVICFHRHGYNRGYRLKKPFNLELFEYSLGFSEDVERLVKEIRAGLRREGWKAYYVCESEVADQLLSRIGSHPGL